MALTLFGCQGHTLLQKYLYQKINTAEEISPKILLFVTTCQLYT